MIACDTNLLVYSSRAEVPWHSPALAAVRALAEGRESWGLPWPCIHEFLATVTSPRIFRPPTPMAQALAAVAAWQQAPTAQMLGETAGYEAALARAITESRAVGALVHDAHIAALCQLHGARELWTADRDFSRFPSLRCRNPLVG
ncbi:MAG: type II toxin-antitoxin system VapC family toxin [Terriglobales bacterium]